MTSAEVADDLGCSVDTIRRMVADGRLVPITKLPGKTGAYLFDPGEIARIAEGAQTKVVVSKPLTSQP